MNRPFNGTKEQELWFATFAAAIAGLSASRCGDGVGEGLALKVAQEATLIADAALTHLRELGPDGKTVFD
jgi:hypothetical protein